MVWLVVLWFSEMLVYECYAAWWYHVGVIGYVHFSEAFEYIRVIEPIAEAFDAHVILGREFRLCFGLAIHDSRYCGCLLQTLVPLTILSPVTWHSSTMGFWSTIEYIYGLSVIQCLYGHVSQKAFGLILGFFFAIIV